MIEELALPLLLAKSLSKVKGKTRFQKLVFIVQNRARQQGIHGEFYHYEPYLYGPFSAELAKTIDNLVASNSLLELREVTSSGYTIFEYKLTGQGENLIDRITGSHLVDSNLVNLIQNVTSEYGQLPLPELVAVAKKSGSP